jgi:hypothetical protein
MNSYLAIPLVNLAKQYRDFQALFEAWLLLYADIMSPNVGDVRNRPSIKGKALVLTVG